MWVIDKLKQFYGGTKELNLFLKICPALKAFEKVPEIVY